MKSISLVFLALTLGPWARAAPEKAEAVVGDVVIWETLQSGEPVLLCDPEEAVKEATKTILAGIIIEAPVKSVWEVVTDKEAATEYVKNLKRAEVLERGIEDGLAYEIIEQDIKLGLFPVIFTYRLKHELQPYDRIDFKRTSGDLREAEGYWRFIPVDEGARTLLIYQLEIDPGRLIPRPVVRNALRKSLPDALRGVRDRVAELAELAGSSQD